MPIDPSVAIGADLGEFAFSWNSSDVLLYHMGIGAGADPASPRELRYAHEKDLRVLLSFATVAPTFHRTEPPKMSFPGIEIDMSKILHGQQSVTTHRPIPTAGKAVCRGRTLDVLDKGSAAVIVQQEDVVADDGEALWTAQRTIFARGEGGFGGERGSTDKVEFPNREPDAVIERATLPQQALLYRLCGDRNAVHAEPDFAQAAGFPTPILHGLCTYGIVAKAVTDTFVDGDANRVGSWSARFAGIVFPGETLRINVWVEDDRFLITADAVERDAPALADGVLIAS